MQIELEGRTLEVPPEYVQKLAEDLWAMMEQMYKEKIGDGTKAGLMAVTRALLVKEELEVRMKHGKEAARAMRPPGNTDPNLWLARQFLPYLRESINGTKLVCQTTGDTITNLALSIPNFGDAGRQMDSSGNIWLRQDDGRKES